MPPQYKDKNGNVVHIQNPIADDGTALCMCGCGQPAPISTYNDKRKGYVVGVPKRYVSGHQYGKGNHAWRNRNRVLRRDIAREIKETEVGYDEVVV